MKLRHTASNVTLIEKQSDNYTQNNYPHEDFQIDIAEILAILHRQIKGIAICVLIAVVSAIIYFIITPSKYTATASIIIDPRQKMIIPDLMTQMMSFRENLIIDSQIEIIHSDKLMRRAAERLGVLDGISEKEFLRTYYADAMLSNTENDQIKESERLTRSIISDLRSGLEVERVGNTYVLKINYTSKYRRQAAARANLIAETYLDNELSTQFEASKRMQAWLEQWVENTRNDLNAIEQKVKDYKSEKNLVESEWGESVTNQQLIDINTRLSAATVDIAQAEADYASVLNIIESGDPISISSNLLSNDVITDLRSEHIKLSQSATNIERLRGKEHKSLLNIKQRIDDIERLMLEEYQRIAEGYKSVYRNALARQKALQKESDILSDSSLVGQQKHIELSELQLRADSIRSLYAKLLNNLNEQMELQTAPFTQGRIINYAQVPRKSSWPNGAIIFPVALIAGLGLGIVFAFAWNYLRGFILKAEELEEATQRTCLGMIPKLDLDIKKYEYSTERGNKSLQPVFNLDLFNEFTSAVDAQAAATTEIMRNIQLSVQQQNLKKDGTVISFVSANSQEGKTLTSCFLAKHLAKTGARVALLDCDFRRPSLTNMLLKNSKFGLYELALQIDQKQSGLEISELEDQTIFHPVIPGKLSFAPAKGKDTSVTNLNLIISNKMQSIVKHLRTQFDYILVDLPPIGNIVDARAIANAVDNFIFIAQWGKTDSRAVRAALRRAPEVHEKTIGTILTQVDFNIAQRYGYYGYGYHGYFEQ